MVIPRTVVLVAVLIALLCLPCAVALMMRAESFALRRAWLRRGRLDLPALRRLDRALSPGSRRARLKNHALCDPQPPPAASPLLPPGSPSLPSASPSPAPGAPSLPPGSPFSPLSPRVSPSLRQVEAELRRLDAQRHGGPTGGSKLWTAAVDRAYDEWLQLACRYLSVTQHLPAAGDPLDRDIERLRVEAELAAAGLRIRPAPRRPEA